MPEYLAHLHSTRMPSFLECGGRISVAHSDYLPGSLGVLLSVVSVNVYTEAQKGIKDFSPFQPHLDVFLRRNE